MDENLIFSYIFPLKLAIDGYPLCSDKPVYYVGTHFHALGEIAEQQMIMVQSHKQSFP